MKKEENAIKNLCVKRKNGIPVEFGFLHIGADTAVRTDDIIGIFDIDNTTVSRHTRGFLNSGEKAGIVSNLAPDIPVSFVVVSGKEDRIYFSQYSPRSLAKHCTEGILRK